MTPDESRLHNGTHGPADSDRKQLGNDGNSLRRSQDRLRAKRRRQSRRLINETLETRQLLAGPDLIAIEPIGLDDQNFSGGVPLIRDGIELPESPTELIFRFDDNSDLDPQTVAAGISVTRAGPDGSFESATALSDLGTNNAVQVEFVSRSGGASGNGIQVFISSSDRGPNSNDQVGVSVGESGRRLTFDLNNNESRPATVRDLINAVDANTDLVEAVQVSGASQTPIGNQLAGLIELELSGANSAQFVSDFGTADTFVKVTATEPGEAGLGVSVDLTVVAGAAGNVTVLPDASNPQRIRITASNGSTVRQVVDAINGVTIDDRRIAAQVQTGDPNAAVGNVSAFGLVGVTDILVEPGFVGLGDTPHEVVFRFSEELPEDRYQIDVNGSGLLAVRNVNGEAVNGGRSETTQFTVDVAPRVAAVVPSPVRRDASGNLTQSPATIDVYFDGQVDMETALNRDHYQLIFTRDTATNTDDVVINPRMQDDSVDPPGVTFDPSTGAFTLHFDGVLSRIQDPDAPLGTFLTGSARLRIGTELVGNQLPDAPVNVTTFSGDQPDQFDLVGAMPIVLGETAGAVESRVIGSQVISNANAGLTATDALNFPGGPDAAGVRAIRPDDPTRLDRTVPLDVFRRGADIESGVTTINYEFPITWQGDDPNVGQQEIADLDLGETYRNLITDQQRQRVREVLSLYSEYLGVQFVEGDDVDSSGNLKGQEVTDLGTAGAATVTVFNERAGSDNEAVTIRLLPSNEPGIVFEEQSASLIVGRFFRGSTVSQVTTALNDARFENRRIHAILSSGNADAAVSDAEILFDNAKNPEFQIAVGDLYGATSLEGSAAGGVTVGTRPLNGFGDTLLPSVEIDTESSLLVMDAQDFDESVDDQLGGEFFRGAFLGVGQLLGYGYSDHLPQPVTQATRSVLNPGDDNEPLFPSPSDIVNGQFLYRPDSNDIDLFPVTVASPGTLRVQTIAERLENSSPLDTHLRLYQDVGTPTAPRWIEIAANDDYFSDDSSIELTLDSGGSFLVGVSSTGNDSYDPTISESGSGGLTEGSYELKLSFQGDTSALPGITDFSGNQLDGDFDGIEGGEFNYWFTPLDPVNTLLVDSSAAPGGNGSVSSPYNEIDIAFNNASPGDAVRIVDGTYEIGVDNRGLAQKDGTNLLVPAGVQLIVDAGAEFIMRQSRIAVGSVTEGDDRSGGSIQILGTPGNEVVFRGLNNSAGDWGGIDLRSDIDGGRDNPSFPNLEDQGIFLNHIQYADIRNGGGIVNVAGVNTVVSPIELAEVRATILNNLISDSADAAIGITPNTFEQSYFDEPEFQSPVPFTPDYQRIGPSIFGNDITGNSINGLFTRLQTRSGESLERLGVNARFDDTDVVHVLTENLLIEGSPGGSEVLANGDSRARLDPSLTIDPGIVLKLNGARIDVLLDSHLYAEGTQSQPIIITSLSDDRYGAGGTFDTNQSEANLAARPGDWGGIYAAFGGDVSIDHATIALGGGRTRVEGGFGTFNVLESHQADLRVAHTRFEDNSDGRSFVNDPQDVRFGRVGRGDNASGTIFVRGSQPIVIDNEFIDSKGPVLSFDINSFIFQEIVDSGRNTGRLDAMEFNGNSGPLIQNNRIGTTGFNDTDDPDNRNESCGDPLGENPLLDVDGNVIMCSINGLEIRGGQVATEVVLDDTDIVHVVRDTIEIPNQHIYGGLRIESSARGSLVVKFQNQDRSTTSIDQQSSTVDSLDQRFAGIVAGGSLITAEDQFLDIADRIGGSLQVVGHPDFPVVLTALLDDTIGAGFTPDGRANVDTDNNDVRRDANGDPIFVLTSEQDLSPPPPAGLPLSPEYDRTDAINADNANLIDNDIDPNVVGFFEADVQYGAEILDGVRVTLLNDDPVAGQSALLAANYEFLYTTFVDVDFNIGNAVPQRLNLLGPAAVPTLIGPDRVRSEGFFLLTTAGIIPPAGAPAPTPGGPRAVTWIAETFFIDNRSTVYTQLSFETSDGAPYAIGNVAEINVISFLDQGIPDDEDDVLYQVGTPGEPDFRAITINQDTPDNAQVNGFSHGGIYIEDGLNLREASYRGWLADDADDLENALDNDAYEAGLRVPGIVGINIDNGFANVGLPPIENQTVGTTALGTADIATAFAWSLNGSASESIVTHFVEHIPSDPAEPFQPSLPPSLNGSGTWDGLTIREAASDANVYITSEAEPANLGSLRDNDTNSFGRGENEIPGQAQFLGELAPDVNSGDNFRRLGFIVEGTIAQPGDLDVYSFIGEAGSQVWLDIDRTNSRLDTVVELINENGVIRLLSDNSVNESIGSGPMVMDSGLVGQPLSNDIITSNTRQAHQDAYSTNPRDAGMRIILPGDQDGQRLLYHVRVRSSSNNLTNPANIRDGQTSGGYQLQVRLQEDDIFAGTQVRYSDVRFATNGIQVIGGPLHSPIAGDEFEKRGDNDSLQTAQRLGLYESLYDGIAGTEVVDARGRVTQLDSGELIYARNTGGDDQADFVRDDVLFNNPASPLTSDRLAKSIGGFLSSETDVDWYQFDVQYDQLTRDETALLLSTVFDVDYASGAARADTSIYVFDESGNLLLIGTDSNIADDQQSPAVDGSDLSDLSRGSLGNGDPFIGSMELSEGQYYLAIANKSQVPQELDQFFNATALNPQLRLEPVDSIRRIAEDRIYTPVQLIATDAAGNVLTDVNGQISVSIGSLDDTGAIVTTEPIVQPQSGEIIPTGSRIAVEQLTVVNPDTGTTVISGLTFARDPATTNFVVLEGFAGGGTASAPVVPVLFDNDSFVQNSVDDFVLYVNTGTQLFAVNPATGQSLLAGSVGGFGEEVIRDVAFRPNGELFGYTDNTPPGDENYEYVRIDPADATLTEIATGAGIETFHDLLGDLLLEEDSDDGIQVEAITIGDFSTQVTGEQERSFLVGNRPIPGRGLDYTTNILYEFDVATGQAIGPNYDRDENDAGAGTSPREIGNLNTDPPAIGFSTFLGISDATVINTAGNPVAGLVDGDFFTVSDVNNNVTFEFDQGFTIDTSGFFRNENTPNANFEGERILVDGIAATLTFSNTTGPGGIAIDLRQINTSEGLAVAIANGLRSQGIAAITRGNQIAFPAADSVAISPRPGATTTVTTLSGTPSVASGNVPILLLPTDDAQIIASRIETAVASATSLDGVSAVRRGAFSHSVEIVGGFVEAVSANLTAGGLATGGLVRGIELVGNQLFAVTDTGGLFVVSSGELQDNANRTVGQPVQTATDLAGLNFTGLRESPLCVQDGTGEILVCSDAIRSDVAAGRNGGNLGLSPILVGITGEGVLHAFNTDGELVPAFAGGRSSIATGIGGAQGLDFSITSTNLWHVTTTRGGQAGHGINELFNAARPATAGGNSIAFNYQNGAFGSGFGSVVEQPTFAARLDGTTIEGTYNIPGGAKGELLSNPISLVGYSAADLPTLYFNYLKETEGDGGADALRVYVVADDGVEHLVATSNLTSRAGVANDEFDDPSATPNSPYSDDIDVDVQPLFGTTGLDDDGVAVEPIWRQARVPLKDFAGQSEIRLRIEFSTSGNTGSNSDALRVISGAQLSVADDLGFEISGQSFFIDLAPTIAFPSGRELQSFYENSRENALITIDGVEYVLDDGTRDTTDTQIAIPLDNLAQLTSGELARTVASFIENDQLQNLRGGSVVTEFDFSDEIDGGDITLSQNDLLFEATELPYFGGIASISGSGSFGTQQADPLPTVNVDDVDLQRVEVTAGTRIEVDVDLDFDPEFDGLIRFFDEAGDEIPSQEDIERDVTFVTADRDGAIYIGFSAPGNGAYDPRLADSGSPGIIDDYVARIDIIPETAFTTNGNVVEFFRRGINVQTMPASLLELSDPASPPAEQAVTLISIRRDATVDDVTTIVRSAVENQLGLDQGIGLPLLGTSIRLPGYNLDDSGPFFDTNDRYLFDDGFRQGISNNNFEGVYLDDIIIGFAERGEIATRSNVDTIGVDTSFVTDPSAPSLPTTTGAYQIEIRDGSEYVSSGTIILEAETPTLQRFGPDDIIVPFRGEFYGLADGFFDGSFIVDSEVRDNAVAAGLIIPKETPRRREILPTLNRPTLDLSILSALFDTNPGNDPANADDLRPIFDNIGFILLNDDLIPLERNETITATEARFRTFDTNDRLGEALALRFPAGSDLQDGLSFSIADEESELTFRFTLDDSADLPGDNEVLIEYSSSSTASDVAGRFVSLVNSQTVRSLLNMTAIRSNGTVPSNSNSLITDAEDARVNLSGDLTINVPAADFASAGLSADSFLITYNQRGDANRDRSQQGVYLIENSRFLFSSESGIEINRDRNARALSQDLRDEFPVVLAYPSNLIELNSEGLLPGAVIQNNVFAFNANEGLNIRGLEDGGVVNLPIGGLDANGNPLTAPSGGTITTPVGFDKIVNNTLIGGVVEAGFNPGPQIFSGILFPSGGISFADQIVTSSLGSDVDDEFTDEQAALSSPDARRSNIEPVSGEIQSSLSLGTGGSVTFLFADNLLTGSDSPASDLIIFETGQAENVRVEISRDNRNFIDVTPLGQPINANNREIDIDSFGFGSNDRFAYVRITDLDSDRLTNQFTGGGADIDAIGALSTVPAFEYTPGSQGIVVNENAAPTLLNNIVANFQTGISVSGPNPLNVDDIDSSQRLTVIGAPTYYRNTFEAQGIPGQSNGLFAQSPDAFSQIFIDPTRLVFAPQDGAITIDSSIDSLEERASLATVLQAVGLNPSPILAPTFDLNGQVRSDDPDVDSPNGIGFNVFKDRGAEEQFDRTGPRVTVVTPRGPDAGPLTGSVTVQANLNDPFDLQLIDGLITLDPGNGVGIDDASVRSTSFRLIEQKASDNVGRILVENVDYRFNYEPGDNLVRFTPIGGIWELGSVYSIEVLGNDTGVIEGLPGTSFGDGNFTQFNLDDGRIQTLEVDTGINLTIFEGALNTEELDATGAPTGRILSNIQGQTITIFDGVSDEPITFELRNTNLPNGGGNVPVRVGQQATGNQIAVAVAEAVNQSTLHLHAVAVGNRLQFRDSVAKSNDEILTSSIREAAFEIRATAGYLSADVTLSTRLTGNAIDGKTLRVFDGTNELSFILDTNADEPAAVDTVVVNVRANDRREDIGAALRDAINSSGLGVQAKLAIEGETVTIGLEGLSDRANPLAALATVTPGAALQPEAFRLTNFSMDVELTDNAVQVFNNGTQTVSTPQDGALISIFDGEILRTFEIDTNGNLIAGDFAVAVGVNATPREIVEELRATIERVEDLEGISIVPNSRGFRITGERPVGVDSQNDAIVVTEVGKIGTQPAFGLLVPSQDGNLANTVADGDLFSITLDNDPNNVTLFELDLDGTPDDINAVPIQPITETIDGIADAIAVALGTIGLDARNEGGGIVSISRPSGAFSLNEAGSAFSIVGLPDPNNPTPIPVVIPLDATPQEVADAYSRSIQRGPITLTVPGSGDTLDSNIVDGAAFEVRFENDSSQTVVFELDFDGNLRDSTATRITAQRTRSSVANAISAAFNSLGLTTQIQDVGNIVVTRTVGTYNINVRNSGLDVTRQASYEEGDDRVYIDGSGNGLRGVSVVDTRISDEVGNKIDDGRIVDGEGQAGDVRNINIFVGAGFDYGDAPGGYRTLARDGGPRHLVGEGFALGDPSNPAPLVTAEIDANLDDNDNDNGIEILSSARPGFATQIGVSIVNDDNRSFYLDAWFDWNANRQFDAGEVARFGSVGTGRAVIGTGPNQTINVMVPSTAVLGETYARFRLSEVDSLGPIGEAFSGEVEDYRIVVTNNPFQNPIQGLRHDVNDSGFVSPIDALQVINAIGRNGGSNINLSVTPLPERLPVYPDVNGDGNVTALDALQVINELARLPDSNGEQIGGEGELIVAANSLGYSAVASGVLASGATRLGDQLLAPEPVSESVVSTIEETSPKTSVFDSAESVQLDSIVDSLAEDTIAARESAVAEGEVSVRDQLFASF